MFEMTQQDKSNHVYLQIGRDLLTNINNEFVTQIAHSTNNSILDQDLNQVQLNISRQISADQIRQMREQYEKNELRRQLKCMLQKANLQNEIKILTNIDQQNQEELFNKLQSLNFEKSRQQQVFKAYSTQELKERQQEGRKFTQYLKIDREKRLRKLETIQEKERELQLQKFEQEKLREQEKIEQRVLERKHFLEEKSKERTVRQSQREQILMITDGSQQKQSIVIKPSNQYLYKRIEEKFHSTLIIPQQKQYEQIIQERRKMMKDVSVSISDMRKHNQDYQKRLYELSQEKDKKRKELKYISLSQDNSQSNIDESQINNSNTQNKSTSNKQYQNKFHKQILQEQLERYQQEIKEKEKKKNILIQREIYNKMVKEVYKPKKSERLEELTIQNKERYSKNRLDLTPQPNKSSNQATDISPYKDYLKELKLLRKNRLKITSISQEKKDSTDIHDGDQKPNLDYSPKNQSYISSQKKQSKSKLNLRINRNIVLESINTYSNNMTPVLNKESSLNKSQDYLAQMRRDREANEALLYKSRQNQSPNMSNLGLRTDRKFDQIKFDIKKSMQQSNSDAYTNAIERMRMFEEQVKRREKYINLQKQIQGTHSKTSLDEDEEINHLYLQAIDAKLTILNNI